MQLITNKLVGYTASVVFALYGTMAAAKSVDDGKTFGRDILGDLLLKAQDDVEHGNHPIMIFDLDDTIFDAGSRTLAILNDLSNDPDLRGDFPDLSKNLASLSKDDIYYEFSDNLDMLGIKSSALREKATKYWNDRFFKSCDIDAIHQEAKNFVLQAHAKGVHVVYLTGRDEPRMKDCTVKSLRLNGLPMGAAATLMLKPAKEMPDVEFKQEAFKIISQIGVVVAGFDNEPANVNAMEVEFPEAEIVFINTRHSNRPDQPFPSISWYQWQY